MRDGGIAPCLIHEKCSHANYRTALMDPADASRPGTRHHPPCAPECEAVFHVDAPSPARNEPIGCHTSDSRSSSKSPPFGTGLCSVVWPATNTKVALKATKVKITAT